MTDTIEERITDALREFAAHVLTTTTGRAVNPLLLDRCVEAEVDKAQAMLLASLDYESPQYNALLDEFESLEHIHHNVLDDLDTMQDDYARQQTRIERLRGWMAAGDMPPEPPLTAAEALRRHEATAEPAPPEPHLAIVKDLPDDPGSG